MEKDQVEPVNITRHFTVPADVVFDAWTNTDLIKQWLFKTDTNRIIQVIMELEPNGTFSIVEQTEDGQLIDHFGQYHEIAAPQLLSFSLEAPEHFPGISSVVVRIDPADDGCTLHFLQTGVDPNLVQKEWERMFDIMEKLLD